MVNFYETLLKPILTNQIIVDWISPIITGLIIVIIPALIAKFFKNKNLIKNINFVNNKIIDTIRPFIIQRIEIDSKFISNIRNAIIKENNIKEKYIYNELDIRNKLLLDISETRFLKENEKKSLIEFTYHIFENYNENQINCKINNEEILEKKQQNLLIKLNVIIMIISLFTMLIVYIITPEIEKIENNIIVIMSMVALILSFASFFSISLFDVNGFIHISDNVYESLLSYKKAFKTYKKNLDKIKNKYNKK